MSLSYRVFVADENSVVRVSQKAFDDFYFRGKASLKQFSGRVITLAVVFYELEKRKPSRVIRIDTQRMKVTMDGSANREDMSEAMRLAVNRLDPHFGGPSQSLDEGGVVMDATKRFDERRWKQRHPELPGPALRGILRDFFGDSYAT